MMRNELAPIDCDQRTNSRSLSERNSARTRRATLIQPVRPITAMIVQMDGRRKASTASSRNRRGNTSMRSTRRITMASIVPPWYPAAAPSARPIKVAMPTDTKPTARETRAPYSIREKTSRPS